MATEKDAVAAIYSAGETLRRAVETATTTIKAHVTGQHQRVKDLADSLLAEHLTMPTPRAGRKPKAKAEEPTPTPLRTAGGQSA